MVKKLEEKGAKLEKSEKDSECEDLEAKSKSKQ